MPKNIRYHYYLLTANFFGMETTSTNKDNMDVREQALLKIKKQVYKAKLAEYKEMVEKIKLQYRAKSK